MQINSIQSHNYKNNLKQNPNQRHTKDKVSFGELKLNPVFAERILKNVPEAVRDKFTKAIRKELESLREINLREILYKGYDTDYKQAIDMVVDDLGDKANNLEMELNTCSIYAKADFPGSCGQVVYWSNIKHAFKPGKDYDEKIFASNILNNHWEPGEISARLDCLLDDKENEFYNLHIMPFEREVYASEFLRIPRCSESKYSVLFPTRRLLENHLQQVFEPLIRDNYEKLKKDSTLNTVVDAIGSEFIA